MCYFYRLDDEIWEVRLHLDGKDNLERRIGSLDITFINMLAMVDEESFGWGDNMYYVRKQWAGNAGMAVIVRMKHVEEILSIYEDVMCVSITVTKGKEDLPTFTNRSECEERVHVSNIGEPPMVYSVDMMESCLIVKIQKCNICPLNRVITCKICIKVSILFMWRQGRSMCSHIRAIFQLSQKIR
jgi:hypothetical protein